jgi:hypothetical protein
MIKELVKNGSTNLINDTIFYVIRMSDGKISEAKCEKIVLRNEYPFVTLLLDTEFNTALEIFEPEDPDTEAFVNREYFAFLNKEEAEKRSKIMIICNLEKEYNSVQRTILSLTETMKSLEEQMEELNKDLF